MRSPIQTWFLFTLCLLVVAPAMAWVTWKALELDRAEFAARLQAEQEVEVSRALWSIDSRLTPLLAEEAARPDFVYRALGNTTALEFSNLGNSNQLNTAPNPVLLHFELKPSGQGVSPQIAQTKGKQEPEPASGPYHERMADLTRTVSFHDLLAELPEQSLPQLTLLANADPSEQPQEVVQSNTKILEGAYAQSTRGQQIQSDGNPAANNAYANNASRQQSTNPGRGQDQAAQYAQAEGSQGNAADVEENSRVGKDLRDRNAAYQSYAQRAIAQQRLSNTFPNERRPVAIREGISRPVWIDDKLIFARRVERGDETTIQGCWLDWQALRQELLAEVKGLPSGADLRPLRAGDELRVGRLLATLPVQLVVPPPPGEPPAASPIRIALAVAWGCLAFAAVASAWLLQGVVALSERRASFVSAVTHELRTPLTTFRMYAEMLAADMVTTPQQKQQYLETLCVEADRLTHLVDNVLLYARLERGRRPGRNRVTLTIDELLERFVQRIADRAEQSNLKLEIHCDEQTRSVALCTDPGAVEQIVFNLIDNACKYGGGGQGTGDLEPGRGLPAGGAAPANAIVLEATANSRHVNLSVRDFGPGLSPTARRRLFEPFSKSSEEAAVSAPGVGLGLALSKRLAADLDGQLDFMPASPGARFTLTLPR